MNVEKLIQAIHDVALLRDVDLQDIQEVVKNYPYFALGQMLLTKKMQQSKHLLLKKEIKKTAVLVPDRKLLYAFLYQKEIQTQVQQAQSHESAKKLESVEQELPIQEPPTETPSSFNKPVAIPTRTKKTSSFQNPIDLKSLGQQKKNEMDILEQQIIGSTIEHVLTQEIANQYELVHSSSEKSEKPINKPSSDKQKFSNWLEILDQDRLQAWRKKETPISAKESTHTLSESDIINSFLSKGTKIITPTQPDEDFTPSNLARLSIVDDEDFVTETLADIYAKQGNINKAIKAYQKLLLKYPEKKTYFAARIEKLEKDLK